MMMLATPGIDCDLLAHSRSIERPDSRVEDECDTRCAMLHANACRQTAAIEKTG